jgi:fumarate reductase subunit D
VHRISGLGLTIFLPAHFLVLGRALTGAEALDGVLAWTERPLVKASEVALVFLLAVHLGGGLRLLLAEFGGWRAAWQPALIAATGGVAVACALLFALNLV